MLHILAVAGAGGQSLFPTKDGLATHADGAGQFGIGDANATHVSREKFPK
jgi:hypothetical protein